MGYPTPNPLFLSALDGSVWLVGINSSGIVTTTEYPSADISSPLSWYELNDVQTGVTWKLSVEPNLAQPSGPSGILHVDESPIPNPSAPTQLLVSANSTLYFIQIANGIMQSGLAVAPTNIVCATPISVLASNVLERLEDPTGIFWLENFEIYTALVEALNDYLLLVGRPTNAVTQPITLLPNTVWQSIPKGIFLITDLYSAQGTIRRSNLFGYDYVMPGNVTPTWENDTSSYPRRWFPVGFNMFGVHPAPQAPITVTMTGVQYPVAEAIWPPTGNETVPFHEETYVAMEMYAAHYCRIKEGGAEAQEGLSLYESYLQLARRFSTIESKRDPLLFANVPGARARVSPITER